MDPFLSFIVHLHFDGGFAKTNEHFVSKRYYLYSTLDLRESITDRFDKWL